MYDKRSFLSGLAMGLCGKGDPTKDAAASLPYYFSPNSKTLTINKDDGSLTHNWDWRTMQYNVEAVK